VTKCRSSRAWPLRIADLGRGGAFICRLERPHEVPIIAHWKAAARGRGVGFVNPEAYGTA
jgi:hypothetical protein